jgi:V/A-type H+-transporting ATPase subunit E
MAEDIQGLLNRIQSDGIEKAEAEKKRILDNAKQQADELVAKAKAEAEAIMKSAREEAVISENKGKAAVKQAARDVILSLQTELQKCTRSPLKTYTDIPLIAKPSISKPRSLEWVR